MTDNDYAFYTQLLRTEVVPALGCTEPVAVALAAAKARQALGELPASIAVAVSGNLLKNGMGVAVPGTGMTGLAIAAAVGAIGGNPDTGLETLSQITKEHVCEAQKMLANGLVTITLATASDPLYVAVTAKSKGHTGQAILQGSHTNITKVKHNSTVLFEQKETTSKTTDTTPPLTLQAIYEFATTVPTEQVRFILEGRDMNMAIAKEGLAKEYGLQLGRTIQGNIAKKILADDMTNHALMLTTAAIDARMDGALLPVMSNSGSGDQGIACSLPIIAFAEKLKSSEKQLIRALVLANLTAIHIKQFIGRLSAQCGVFVAAIGASCGITFLLGGEYTHLEKAVQNMLGSNTGMICDGAKNGCTLKGYAAVSSAIMAAHLALAGHSVTGQEGIVANSVEKSIANLGRLTQEGLTETDKIILDIMVKKANH